MKKKLIGFTLATTALLTMNSGSILRPSKALSNSSAPKKSIKWSCYSPSNKYLGLVTSDLYIWGELSPMNEAQAINKCNTDIDFGYLCEGKCTVKPEKY